MIPKTREEARDLRSKYYLTGIPCPQGHISVRFTSVGTCKECGREKAMLKHIHTTNKRRSYCGLEGFIKIAQDKHKNFYTYENAVYVNAHTLLQVECPLHGSFMISPTNHLQGKGKGCKQCAIKRTVALQIKSVETFIAQAMEIWRGKFDYSLVDYKGAKSLVRLICSKHPEEIIFQQPTNHLSNQDPCSRCNHMRSKGEQNLADFLAQYTRIVQGDRNTITPKEIDILLPEFNIGVEYHGLWCHISKVDKGEGEGEGESSKFNKPKNYHREKYETAAKAGVRLIQIFEDEWLNKQDIVKARLLAAIGLAPQYDARKLQLSRIDMAEARPFLVATHIQGAGVAHCCYALKQGDQIIAVATFGKARSGAMTGAKSKITWEVIRYASIGRVRGGFSRLMAQFKRDIDPEQIISYCDLRYGTGGLYETTGFTLHSITEPDYWWVPKGEPKRIPRYAVQKHKLANSKHELNKFYAPDKTEAQICGEAGWKRIHGVGSQKWIWNK